MVRLHTSIFFLEKKKKFFCLCRVPLNTVFCFKTTRRIFPSQNLPPQEKKNFLPPPPPQTKIIFVRKIITKARGWGKFLPFPSKPRGKFGRKKKRGGGKINSPKGALPSPQSVAKKTILKKNYLASPRRLIVFFLKKKGGKTP